MTPPDQLEQRLAALSPEKRELVRRRLEQAASASAAIPRAPRRGPRALSSAQQRLWFLSQLEGPSATYNVATALRLSGSVDHTLIARAMHQIIGRHDALRTRFVRAASGEPEQHIAAVEHASAFRLTVETVRGESGRDIEAEMLRRAQEEARRPFNLATDALLRLTIIEHATAAPLLVFVAHHIITDGWSMGVLAREVAEAYAALASDTAAALPDLPIQYADYAEWERAASHQPAVSAAIEWWREYLRGAPASLDIPTDRPRPPAQTYRGGVVRFTIPLETMGALRSIAEQARASVFSATLTLTAALLGRYAATDDVIVGCPLANRRRRETESLIGFFVNTLPIRVTLDPVASLRTLIGRTHAAVAAVVAREELPFERLVDAIQPARDMTRTPIFQAVLAYQPAREPLELGGIRATAVPLETGTAKFDLTFILDDSDGGCDAVLEYNSDLFDGASAQRMVTHFCSLLGSAVAHPDAPLSGIAMMSNGERAQIVEAWSGVTTGYPRHASVPELFADTVAANQDAIALVTAAESVTYAELDARASHIAAALQSKGVAPGEMVGLCASRSTELLAAMIGILKAGAIYVPIDPSYPDARVTFVLRDTRARLVLTHDATPAVPDGCEILAIASVEAMPRTRHQPVVISADACAYVMYTSGSTGEPKGVLVPHRAIARLVRGTDFMTIDRDDTFLQLAPVSFDASTLEIWAPLLNGARLAIAAPHALSLSEIGAAIRRHQVSTLWLTSSLFNVMVDERVDDLAGVRQLLVGGDVLSVPHVARAAKTLKQGRIINGYGPTENTTFTCCHAVDPELAYGSAIPIGRPIANTSVYILDRLGRPAPIGIAGELYAAGDGVALGYLNQPQLTADRFVPNPFGAGHMYRTGDAARWRPDGTIEFLGRLDEQVKVRGYRVEPREVEAAILKQSGIAQAHVIARKTALAVELVAYIVPAHDADAAIANCVETALRAALPDFMLPSAIVSLAALPLTMNGKVDRAALPEPHRAGSGTFAAPATPTEGTLAAIYAELLELDRVSTADSFFSLGGHSLSATKLVSRIRAAFDVELPLRQIFETPEIARLAPAVDLGRDRAGAVQPPAIPRADRSTPIPLSFAQRRLWFLNRLEPDNPFYNIAIALRLQGHVDIRALEAAMADIVARHEVLRTTYYEIDGEPRQRVHAAGEQPISLALRRVESAAAIDPIARAEARRSFNLETGPVIRTTLVEHGVMDRALLISIHHIAADGWSMGVLVNELTAAYAARVAGGAPPFAPLATQYADFSAWQHDWIGGEACRRDTQYWLQQLAGYPAELPLPSDRPRPAVQSFAGGSITFAIDAQTSARLGALARDCDATLFMTLLAAFAALLSRHSGQQDLVIGSPVAARTQRDLEPLVGFFVNTLALRIDTSGNPSVRELIARAREVALGGFAHQDLPFDRLVDEIQPVRDLSRNPLFQVMFALQNAPMPPMALAGLTVTPLDYERSTAQFDIVLDMWERPDGLVGVFEFSTALFDHATIARMVDQFRTLLAGLVSDPEQRLSTLPLLTDADRRLLLDRFNDTHETFPIDRTLHGLFEDRVARGGDRIAAVEGDTAITYAGLNRRANRLAHRLRRHGIGRNDFVAVLVERGIDFAVAMLGVLKAGAAYVPIDPTYPPDRIEYMATHCQARVVIARRSLLTAPLLQALSGATCVIPEEDQFGDELDTDPEPVNLPADRAYMLYTSGSTGQPKGAILRHNGKINHIYAQFKALQFHRDSIFLQTAPASSDISVWQFLGPLLVGGRTVSVDYETLCDPAALWTVMIESRATIVELVPVAMSALLEHVAQFSPDQRRVASLEYAMITGEAASPAIVNRWLELFPHVPIANAYGPTEAADDVCQQILTRPLPAGVRSVPIGKALSNLWMYVVDENLQLVPIGVPGEICVSGIGVGEGYWQDPEKTAASFVPNPYDSGTRGRWLYRTGDIGFWRADGVLECLSRTDHQIKIRGFRIEAGDIEAVFGSHPSVRDAAVVARDDGQGGKRLAAYVTPQLTSPEVAGELQRIREEQVALWTDLHQSEYQQTLDYGDPTFNVIGWDSTYTGEPLPPAEMREYVANTIDRVMSVAPRRLLEIGCGSGLIMFGLVPQVDRYYGLDLSETAIDRLKSLQQATTLQARVPKLDGAVLRAGRADDLSWLEPGSIDTVIFPSVLQYFPGIDYLRSVLDAVMRVISPNGAIVFGDVRSLPLLEAFHASVTLFKAHDATTAPEIVSRLRERSMQEQEMAIDPVFFESIKTRYAVPMDVRVLPKRGRHQNEMTRFRYDVIVRLGDRAATGREIAWSDWRAERMTIDALDDRLSGQPESVAFQNVANARLSDENRLLASLSTAPATATAADIRESLRKAVPAGVEPEELYALGERRGYHVQLSIARSAGDGRFDAAFVRKDVAITGDVVFPPAESDPATAYANDPLHERLARLLAPRLREYVKARLPHYMVPSDLVLLDRMPTTPAGKVDRRALPVPVRSSVSEPAFRPATTETEKAIVQIWQQVLDIENCGLGQNFFESGGHSLKATQVISRIRQQLGVALPLRTVFAHPTIEELAAVVDGASRVDRPPIARVPDADHYPVSPAQRRLWILAQLEDGSIAYNMPAAVVIDGPLDANRLAAAFAVTVARHESLRTTFTVVDGEPRQRVRADLAIPLRRVDLSAVADPEAAARAEARRDAETSFDLEHGPLVRASLLALAPARHVLLFNSHHIVSDDWSMGVLIREVMSAYGGISTAPLRLQYRDFAGWHHQQLDGPEARGHRAYWLERLSGELPALEMPADRPRPAVKTYRGQSLSASVEAGVTEKLKAVARQGHATLFMALVAATKTLIHRYSGATDVIVAVPASGREHPDLENQIGFYINTLTVRDRVEPEAPFSELLAEVARHTAEAIEHQSYPFDRLVDELPLRRDPSRMPICDVAVVMAATGGPEFSLPGLDIRPFAADYTTSKYDLHFVFDETATGLTAGIVFNPDLFDRDRIERMLGHLQVLLRSIGDHPSTRVGDLAMLAAAERHRILAGFNPAPAPAAPDRHTLTEWFDRTAARFTERTAVTGPAVSGEEELSYGELSKRSSAIAAALIARGVNRGEFVGLLAERSANAVAAILGVLKAGAAYVPIDPSYPADRIQYILDDSKARVLLDGREIEAMLAAPAAEPAQVHADPNDVAYMIYTSGSTGRPKGVMVTHANATRLFTATEPWFRFDESDVWSVFHSLAFDFSVWEIWGALLYGGRAVMVPNEVARDPDAFARVLQDQRVTVLNQTPSAFGALIDAQVRHGWPLAHSLRHVIFGGEALNPAMLQPWFDRFGDSAPRLINMYGITETTVHVTYRPLTVADAGARSVIGEPIPDLQVYLLDSRLQPVPIGVPGEICVGGAGVAVGYWQRRDLTEERFVANPFGDGRLYKSGDLGRYLANGDIEYLGRLDHQVKVRGFRIELGEIEAVLSSCPGVKQSLVIAERHGDGTRLIAYVVGDVTSSDLRRHAHTRLPEYMVPALFVAIDAFPLTAHGKIDRKALAAPTVPGVEPEDASTWSGLQTAIAATLGRALGVDRCDRRANFFDLGAHSLMLIRVHAALQEQLGRTFSLAALYRHPSVEQLAAFLESDQAPAPLSTTDADIRAERRRDSRRRAERRRG